MLALPMCVLSPGILNLTDATSNRPPFWSFSSYSTSCPQAPHIFCLGGLSQR